MADLCDFCKQPYRPGDHITHSCPRCTQATGEWLQELQDELKAAQAALLAERDRPTPTDVFERKAMAVTVGDVLEDGRVVVRVETAGQGKLAETYITVRQGDPGFEATPNTHSYRVGAHIHVRLIGRASDPAAQPARR